MKLLIVAALLAFNASAAETEVVVGKIFPLGSGMKGEPLFTQRTETTTDGKVVRTKAVIKDAKGEVVMTETAVFNDGLIVEQDMEQKQIQERYELRAKDGRLTFRTFKMKDGKEKLDLEKSEKTPKIFLTGPGFQPFLQAQQKRLLAGEKVEAQFGVFELGRSISFDFKKIGEGEGLKVRMEPSSMWLSMIVSSIDMDVDPKTLRLVHYVGRTPLRLKVKNDWKNLDAEIEYTIEKAKP